MNQTGNRSGRPVSLKGRVFSIPTLLSFGIAIALIVFLATQFDLDWSATWDNVRQMNPWLYVLAFALYYMSFLFRGARWRILARGAGVGSSQGSSLPSVGQCSRLILIGWFVNSITWLRLGDAYRAYAFSEDSRGGFSLSLGTILAERVLDTAIVLAVLLVAVVSLTTTRDSAASTYMIAAASAMAFALVALVVLMRIFGARAASFLPQRLEGAYHRFHKGTLGSFKQLPLTLVLGLLAWALEILRLYLVVEALGLNIGFALVPVVALGHAILSTVPTPGGMGAVEPGVTGLLLLALERSDAVSIAVVDRSITYVSVILVGGLVFLLRQVIRARQNRREAEAEHSVVEPGRVAKA